MLGRVGHPAAVNPDRGLRREAAARGWPILDFSHPVTLRTRMAGRVPRVPSPSRPAVAVAAVGAGAATAGLIWYAASRRREAASAT